jgi:hypothetical protein
VRTPGAVRRLTRRLPLLAASLVLSVLFWFIVTAREQVEVGYMIPLAYEGFPSRLVIDGAPLEAVYVRLRGSRLSVDGILPEQLRVRVDLAAARAGNNVIQLVSPMVVVPRGVSVVGISPPVINLKFIPRPHLEEHKKP